MASTDARPVPRKNTAFRYYFAIRKPSDSTLITTWTGADSEVSLDGAAYADCTNEATEIGTTGTGYIDLTAAEMNADCVLLKITVTNTGAVPLVYTLFPEEAGDYRVADSQKVDVDTIKTQAVTAAAGITFPSEIASPTNITAGTITTVTTLTNLPAITANWLTAAGLAADAVTEIQAGLSTLDAAGVRSAVGLASANLDTQLSAIVGDTNELQTDWVDGGRLDLLLDNRASQATLNLFNTRLIPISGSIVAGVSTTTVLKTDVTGLSSNGFHNMVLMFTSPASLQYQPIPIESYNTDGTFTLSEPLTGVPSENDTFDIYAAHVHTVSEIQSGLATQTSVDDLPTNAELATALSTADDATLAAISSEAVKTAAIKAKTDLITTFPTNFSSLGINASGHISRVTLVDTTTTNTDLVTASAIATSVLTTQMTEAYAADGVAPTLAQAIFLMMQTFTEFAISGTTITAKKLDGSTTAATYTLDSATAPTSRTRAS